MKEHPHISFSKCGLFENFNFARERSKSAMFYFTSAADGLRVLLCGFLSTFFLHAVDIFCYTKGGRKFLWRWEVFMEAYIQPAVDILRLIR